MHILPFRKDHAYANMATDLLLLEDYPRPDIARFRHYGWTNPSAWSFGLSQSWEATLKNIGRPADEVVRRPTGGGLVDHADDYTYTLVVPPTSPGYRGNPSDLYQLVHEKIVAAFAAQGLPAALYQNLNTEGLRPVCFTQPERFDIVLPDGKKIAGAAQKRNRHGLLVQGSIMRALPWPVDWDAFGEVFSKGLADYFGTQPEGIDWPELDAEKLAASTEHFRSAAWNQRR